MNFNFNTSVFKEIILNNRNGIFKRTKSGIHETEKFKQFHVSLISYLEKSAKNDFKIILITKENLNKLPETYTIELREILDSEDCILNKLIEINSDLKIIEKSREIVHQNSTDARKYYTELSKETDYVVFLLQPNSLVHYFIDGEDNGKCIFFTEEDFKSFNKKRTIDHICEIFDEYRKYLEIQHIYSNFFIPKTLLRVLHSELDPEMEEKKFIDKYKHVLQNSPEDRLREDLRLFLEERLRVSFLSKEYILENFKRLDIYMMDEFGNELYLIEVKWVGISIHKNGRKLNKPIKHTDINPNAIQQTVNYLKQLHEEDKNIKLGYLVVFDAREEDLPDTCKDFDPTTIFNEEKMKHYRKFRKIPDFRIKNIIPSS